MHTASRPVTPLATLAPSVTDAASATVTGPAPAAPATTSAPEIATVAPTGNAPSTHSTRTSTLAPPISISALGTTRRAVGSAITELAAIRTSVLPPWYATSSTASPASVISTPLKTSLVASATFDVTLGACGAVRTFGVLAVTANVAAACPA